MALKEFLERIGWQVDAQHLAEQPNRANLLVKRPGTTVAGIKYLLNTHLDTVPPFTHYRIGDERIYGRGSNDAKGQIASMIFALCGILEESPELAAKCGLLLVVGEETDHIGMMEANQLGLTPDVLVVGEPTELIFGHAQKGALKLKLICRGRSAHSGYPEKGHSAIHSLLDILADLRQHKWPQTEALGPTTMNVGLIRGGQAMNALAEHAEAGVMFRVTDSADILLQEVETLVAGRAEIDVLGVNEPVHLTKPPHGFESTAVAFNTDIPYFDFRPPKGTFLIGPGSITTAHSQHEFISIDQLEKGPKVIRELINRLESS